MQESMNLKLDWCSHEAAKYACIHWHYSKSIPRCKLVKVGVWEDEIFKGVIIYSPGASAHIHLTYNLKQTEICELTRIALNKHTTPVSRMIALSFKFLKSHCPGIQLLTSFADTYQNHHGGIYQATNWVYAGLTASQKEFMYKGKWRHVTVIYKTGLTKNQIKSLKIRKIPPKHKYLMPLTKQMRKQILPLSKPYPKRVPISTDLTSPVEEGGANPTHTLQINNAG